MADRRIVITGTGAVCAAGMDPHDDPRPACSTAARAIGPIQQWDTTGWPIASAGEIADLNPRALVDDRKLHKLIRRTDLFGLYAAGRAIEAAGIVAHRDALAPRRGGHHSDRTGVYVGSGGGNYENQYDYFPLLTEAQRRAAGVRPRARRHASIRCGCCARCPTTCSATSASSYGLKGANACITNHSVGGMLAVIEAIEALRNGEADRAVAVGHDTPIEPQMVLYYHRIGLLAQRGAAAVRRAPRRQPVRRRRRRAGARDRGVGGERAARRCWAKCWAAATRAKARGCSRSATTATASRAPSRRRWTTRDCAPPTSA